MTEPEFRTTNADGSRFYTHPVTGEELVSVTTVLSATDGKPYLTPWSARLAAEFAVDHLDLLAATVAAEGRDAAVDLAKDQARLLRERKADAGSYVHAVNEALILWAASPEGSGAEITLPTLPDKLVDADYDGDPLDVVVDWMVTGFLNFVAAFNPIFKSAEMQVYNRALGIAGTLDARLILEGVGLGQAGRLTAVAGGALRLCVDFKTGKNIDVTAREQIAAYRRMTEARLPLGDVRPMPATHAGAILHLRPEFPDGFRLLVISPADDAAAWNRFRRALELHQGRAAVGRTPGRVVYPPRPDGTMPSPLLADLDGMGAGRAIGPLQEAGFKDLEQVALLTAAELLSITGIGAKTADTVRRLLADYDLALSDERAMAGVA